MKKEKEEKRTHESNEAHRNTSLFRSVWMCLFFWIRFWLLLLFLLFFFRRAILHAFAHVYVWLPTQEQSLPLDWLDWVWARSLLICSGRACVCVCVRNVYIHHHTLATSSISIHTSVSRFVGICAFSIPFLDFIAKFRVRGCESFVLRLFICAPLFWGAACYSKPCTHCGICRSMAWCTSVNESASTNTITREKESKLR